MDNGDTKPVLKIKNNFDFTFKCVLLASAFIFGSLFIMNFNIYIKNITISKTFFILLFVYLFQLFFEIFKISIFNYNKNLVNEINFKFKLFVNKKFLFINLVVFLICLTLIFSCLTLGMFFNKIEILFNIIMGLGLGIIYFLYTIELFKVINYTFEEWVFKKNKYDFLYLCFINSLTMTFTISIFYLFKYLNGFVFVILVLVNMILFDVNSKYLRKFLNFV